MRIAMAYSSYSHKTTAKRLKFSDNYERHKWQMRNIKIIRKMRKIKKIKIRLK